MRPPVTDDWHRLVEENLPLAYWAVQPFITGIRDRHRIEEYESFAMEGLVRAARLYDPNYRTEKGQSVKFSTYATWAIKHAILRHLIDQKRVKRSHKPAALDAVDPDCNSALLVGGEEQTVNAKEFVRILLEDIELSDRERRIIELYYLQDQSLRDIGAVLQISCERVRQIKDRGMAKLRHLATVLVENDPADRPELVPKVRPKKPCANCGQPFEYKHKQSKYCCEDCRLVVSRRTKKEYRRKTFKPKTNRKRKLCTVVC